MFFDCLEGTALEATPALIVATGGTGRNSLVVDRVLRPIFAHLRTVVMPTAVFYAPEG
ncbi:NAD(P)H-dependent oxidoreductase [Streptomyces sp. NBC_01217]|uniref:NAD(P)H-dependent oxidoreductase n=1 Tax=Streptomyces sp. NBC_01217 TaxID=2903779 RepID=UPI002E16719A|nr:NAD(P)H-dependent oxidoreductase [Streptomyces sp. NBC_01217]